MRAPRSRRRCSTSTRTRTGCGGTAGSSSSPAGCSRRAGGTEYEAEGHARGEVTLYATLLPIEIDGETVISGDGLVMFYARRLACTHRLRLAFGPVPDVLQRSQMLLGYLDGSRKMPRGRPCAWLLPWAALVGCVFALAGAWTAAVLAGLLLTLEGLTD